MTKKTTNQPNSGRSKAYHVDPEHVMGVFQSGSDNWMVLLGIGMQALQIPIDGQSARRLLDDMDKFRARQDAMMDFMADDD